MHKTNQWGRGLVLVLACWIAGPALAAESKREKQRSDETQASYTRKSITYLGMTMDRDVQASEAELKVLEETLREVLEIKRYDYNRVNAKAVGGMDGFVKMLREYVLKRADDRAAAEAQFSDRFGRADVTADDIERVLNSVYLYRIHVVNLRTGPAECPVPSSNTEMIASAVNVMDSVGTDPRYQERAKPCAPGEPVMRSSVTAEVFIYQANLIDASKPATKLLSRLKPSARIKFDRSIQQAGSQKTAAEDAVVVASAFLAEELGRQQRRLLPFKMFTPITGLKGSTLEFHAGAGDSIAIGDTYGILEFDQAGQAQNLGWARVTKLGDAKGTGEGQPSEATLITSKRKLAGGEQLFEEPMSAWGVRLFGTFEVAFKDLTDEESMGFYYGGGLMADVDIGRYLGTYDFTFEIGGEYLLIDGGGLVHVMLGVRKKWLLGPLGIAAGVHAGLGYITWSGDIEDASSIGAGGEALLGIEYYINPHWHVFLHALGRYYYYLGYDVDGTTAAEMGVGGQLGVKMDF